MMKIPFYKRKKFWWAFSATVLLLPVLIISTAAIYLHYRQDIIVKELLLELNSDFNGKVELSDSHISFFQSFPYISIDLENLKIYETKALNESPILHFADSYVGFDLWTMTTGKMEIKSLKFKDGYIDIVQDTLGEMNIIRAISSVTDTSTSSEEIPLNLKKIVVQNVHVSKLNQSNMLLADLYLQNTQTGFKSTKDNIEIDLESEFDITLILEGDTTFVKNKSFGIDTDLNYNKIEDKLYINPTTARLEEAFFNINGSVDFKNDVALDLLFQGSKPDFELFMAMAPDELKPTLKKYENRGKVFFETSIKGKSINGNTPAVFARFGCENGFFNNAEANKKLDDLNFTGYFTNGELRNPSTMEFGLQNFSAKPEAGTFSGNLIVKNFETPDINLQLQSDFQLEFLAKFFDLKNLSDLKGKINLVMNFRDIIDLDQPEKSIERFNESYFTQLKIENLSFATNAYGLPIEDIDVYAEMTGHEAKIEYLNIDVGESDLKIKGSISDLPAIIHHTDIPVSIQMDVVSNFLNLQQLSDSATEEKIKNLSFKAHFNTSAKKMTESPNLPIGEFFIDNLFADLEKYPHTLHDFHADVFIEEEDFRVIDFKGMIDKSDFFFSGRLKNYDLWFAETAMGDTRVEFDLTSGFLSLYDVFSYGGENYIPEDYRREEFRNLKITGHADMHFKDSLHSVDFYLDGFNGRMKFHPMKFENFMGRVHYEEENLLVENFSGQLGNTDFKTTLHYYLGKNPELKKRNNFFSLKSQRLDFDQLFNYQSPNAPTQTASSSNSNAAAAHETGFNIYEVPFTDMTFNLEIGSLNYHKYLIKNFKTKLRTTPEHYIYVDEMKCNAADGSFDMTGYFNGSDPNKIYLSPELKVENVDLDKLMFKFDNFGQDMILSENLHGKISGTIRGNIRVHRDLIPIIEESKLNMDIRVVEGRLDNYAMLQAMSEYFADKNLNRVAFDTLSNQLTLTNGLLEFPIMKINSSIGFMELSGKQDMSMNMDYIVRVPWQMVTQVASSKLFGRRKEEAESEADSEKTDNIQRADQGKRTRFVNLRIKGTPEDFQVSLVKRKDLK